MDIKLNEFRNEMNAKFDAIFKLFEKVVQIERVEILDTRLSKIESDVDKKLTDFEDKIKVSELFKIEQRNLSRSNSQDMKDLKSFRTVVETKLNSIDGQLNVPSINNDHVDSINDIKAKTDILMENVSTMKNQLNENEAKILELSKDDRIGHLSDRLDQYIVSFDDKINLFPSTSKLKTPYLNESFSAIGNRTFNGGSPIDNNNYSPNQTNNNIFNHTNHSGVVTQLTYENCKAKLETLDNPDHVAYFFRQIDEHKIRFPGADHLLRLALLVSYQVRQKLISTYCGHYGLNDATFSSLKDSYLTSLIYKEVKPDNLEKFVSKLNAPLSCKMKDNMVVSSSNFEDYANFILQCVQKFKDRFEILYDPMNQHVCPKVLNKDDGVIKSLITLFGIAANNADLKQNFLSKVWNGLSVYSLEAIQYGRTKDFPEISKLQRFMFFVNEVYAAIEVGVAHSKNTKSLEYKLGISAQPTQPKKPSGDSENSSKTTTPFRHKGRTFAAASTNASYASKQRVYNMEEDDEDIDEYEELKNQYLDSEQLNDDEFEAELAIATQSTVVEKNDRPNGCHEMLYTGECKRYQAQLQRKKNDKGLPIVCSYAHDNPSLVKTHAYLQKQLNASRFKEQKPWPSNNTVSLLTKDTDSSKQLSLEY